MELMLHLEVLKLKNYNNSIYLKSKSAEYAPDAEKKRFLLFHLIHFAAVEDSCEIIGEQGKIQFSFYGSYP